MANKLPTLGLYIICKGTEDEQKHIECLLSAASHNVDNIYLTVTDETELSTIKKMAKKFKNVIVSYFKWVDKFDEARNFNFAQGKTDYKMWIDVGDEFQFSTLPRLREKLADYDSIWMPYNYAYDDQGNCIAQHWRERIVKSSIPFEWRGWIHETLITEAPHKAERINIPVIHAHQDQEGSTIRNHRILQTAYKETNDPRYLHYLGLSYYSLQEWQKAIDYFSEYLLVGGWDEEIYRSLLRMSESYAQLDDDENARSSALQAVSLLPAYPWAYYNLAEIEFQADNWEECLEWLNVAFAKPIPKTNSIYDPTIPEKAKIVASTCKFMLGDARRALQILNTVKGEPTDELRQMYQPEADNEVLNAVLQELPNHIQDKKLLRELWNTIPKDMKYNNKYRKLREQFTEPKIWPKKSIVFFCGQGYEEWGPHTLDKGMGGSEEAVVYLAREFAKKGYDVTVYGAVSLVGYIDSDRESLKVVGNVVYRPWREVDKRDTFDTLVIWRQPGLANQFKADKILIDMHDLLDKKAVPNLSNATYMFKSQFHADQYTVDNFNVIGNGVKVDYA